MVKLVKNKRSRKFLDQFRGIFPAIPTPFTETGSIDEDAIRQLVQHLIRGGVHGIWALGSGGEFPALTDEGKRVTLKTIVEEVKNRIPVIAGISDTSLERVIANSEAAANLGADAVFALTPYYYYFDIVEIQSFYSEVAFSSPLPLVIYYNPHNSKIRIDVQTFQALSRHENVVGIKDSSGDFGMFQALLTAFKGREDFRVFQGDEALLAASFLLGAHGAVAALPVIAPGLVVQLYNAAQSRNIAAAQELQRRCMDIYEVFTVSGSLTDSSFLAGQKAALELLGVCSRIPAKPCAPFGVKEMKRVRDVLHRNGLITVERRAL